MAKEVVTGKDRMYEHYFSEHPKSRVRYGLIRTNLRGTPFEFLTASGVFSRKRVDSGTRLLVESMILPERGRVLDVGCGYGVVGIAAAVLNPSLHVVMLDVNERAIRLARHNAEINCASNTDVRRSRLYEAIRDLQFDCVLSNPPISAGMDMVKALVCEAPVHMKSKSFFQMVVKSKVGGKRLQSFFDDGFGNVNVLARESGYRVLISQKK